MHKSADVASLVHDPHFCISFQGFPPELIKKNRPFPPSKVGEVVPE